jgi:hypothetical protein
VDPLAGPDGEYGLLSHEQRLSGTGETGEEDQAAVREGVGHLGTVR